MSILLTCPETGQPLRELSLQDASRAIAPGEQLERRAFGRLPITLGIERVLVREDAKGAYPIVSGIPVIMRPEMLVSPGTMAGIDTTIDPYREAYEEMGFYDEVAQTLSDGIRNSPAYEMVRRAAASSASRFPEPESAWMDATYDSAAQRDAYQHLDGVPMSRTLQVGGTGIHAVKFLIAGASESWLLTPMLGEAQFALKLAAEFGVRDRLHCVVGLAEEMPFRDASFSGVFTGGCLHHTVTSLSIPEIKRVLVDGGRFAAVEPWKAPLYTVGTKLIGKREVGVNCRPIDSVRAQPLFAQFEDGAVRHHGALSRYPLIALSKFGLKLKLETVRRITRVDDAISDLVPFVRSQGSSVAMLGTKSAIKPQRAA
jgi:uncharacterized protein YbaR (Trm112 family)/SAM-dependent methyltransferase